MNPSSLIDYNDGGAFAECHFVQYPRNMGIGATTFGNATAVTAAAHVSAAPQGGIRAAPTCSTLVVAASRDCSVEETSQRTREALAAALQGSKKPDLSAEDFSGTRQKASARALTVALASVASADPAPIARSPPKTHRRSALEADLPHLQLGESTSASLGSGTGGPRLQDNATAVPFCVSSWRNKKKLIVPVEQRLAHHHDDRMDSGSGIGGNVMALAVAMQAATQEVAAELQSRAAARQQAEERQQAAVEAEEAKRATALAEENRRRLTAAGHSHETREQRLERVRLERELREREKAARHRQRLLEKAAARLNMTVEDLEADAHLLKAVEQPEVAGAAPPPPPSRGEPANSSSSGGDATRPTGYVDPLVSSLHETDEALTGSGHSKLSAIHVMTRGVVSNEGIAREMEALAQLDGHGAPQASDGIRMRSDSEEDEDDVFDMNQLVRKRPRKL